MCVSILWLIISISRKDGLKSSFLCLTGLLSSLLYMLVSDYLIQEWEFIRHKLPPDCAFTVSSLNVIRCVERNIAALVSVEAPVRVCSLSRDAPRNQAIWAVFADEDPNSSLMIFECTSAH